MEWWHYLLTFIGSGAFVSLLQLYLSRIDAKKEKAQSYDKRFDILERNQAKMERDSCRLQLLVMISDFPSEKHEIMILAEHYFSDLYGDWYMTSIFNKWLQDHTIAKPEWFIERRYENEQ